MSFTNESITIAATDIQCRLGLKAKVSLHGGEQRLRFSLSEASVA
jgi:hypothetical protein